MKNVGDQASLFTGALYDMSYSQPWGFCFECGDDPVRVRHLLFCLRDMYVFFEYFCIDRSSF